MGQSIGGQAVWDDVCSLPTGALERIGYAQPTALQSVLLPAIASEHDVLAEVPLGSGRSVAIGVAVADLIADCDPGDVPVAVVVTSSPVRASQLADTITRCGSEITRSGQSGVRLCLADDSGDAEAQAADLTRPLDVVVGNPQRLNQLASTERLSLELVEMVVVDDADHLAVGDQRDALVALLDGVESDRQCVVLASALLPPLNDAVGTRLTSPLRPHLPTVEPLATALPQQAFVVSSPSPSRVVELAGFLGAATTVAIVGPDQQEAFATNSDLVSAGIRVATELADLDSLDGAAVILTRPPTDARDYVSLLRSAERAGCSRVALLTAPGHRQHLRALGKAGGIQLNAAPFPTTTAIETRRTMKLEELLTDQLGKVSSQPTPRFLESVHRLSAEYDVADIAAAAMQLAHEALQREIEPGDDVPLLLQQKSAAKTSDRRQAPGNNDGPQRRKGGDRRGKEIEAGMTRLFVAAGYNYGVRPGDIVGAFAGESGLSGKEIGNIDIRESFTLVEVPENLADDVITAMETGTIKGRQIEVRRERY